MILDFIFIFLFFIVVTALTVFLFCLFLPSLKLNYGGLNSFMFNGEKFAQKDLRIIWRTKHLPWDPRLTVVDRNKGPQIDLKKGSDSSIWKILFNKIFGRECSR